MGKDALEGENPMGDILSGVEGIIGPFSSEKASSAHMCKRNPLHLGGSDAHSLRFVNPYAQKICFVKRALLRDHYQ